jgi:hypothetical protein
MMSSKELAEKAWTPFLLRLKQTINIINNSITNIYKTF